MEIYRVQVVWLFLSTVVDIKNLLALYLSCPFSTYLKMYMYNYLFICLFVYIAGLAHYIATVSSPISHNVLNVFSRMQQNPVNLGTDKLRQV